MSLSDAEKSALIEQLQQRIYELENAPLDGESNALERVLEREEELRNLKSQFITVTSHEFRTPLTIIASSTHLLYKHGTGMSEENRIKHLDKIQRNVFRMAEMLEDIQLLGRLRVQNIPTPSDSIAITPLAQMLVEGYKQRFKETHTFEFVAVPSDIQIIADNTIVEQALNHLMKNAVMYSAPRGHVSVRLALADGQFTMEVADNGMGIPEENWETIFDSFVRGSNAGNIPGVGLGLAITTDIVVLHKGTITFSSQPGNTIFTITLPQHSA